MITRKVYIIPKEDEVANHVTDALANNCAEIIQGIPSKFKDFVQEINLPQVYEESINPNKPLSFSAKLCRLTAVNIGKMKPATLVHNYLGDDYTFQCYISQSIKDEYQAGKIVIGDYVIAEFFDGDVNKGVVIAKVFKTW
jgi:translation initiation factor IF-1